MKTIITHFYNEEFLLPWWLNHHKKYFDSGIMIDYNSTDNSVNIIKSICPNWKIINSKNEYFSAKAVDNEVMEIEKELSGWKIALNVTEFLFGKYSKLYKTDVDLIYIPCFYFVDEIKNRISINKNLPLHEQLFFGIDITETLNFRGCRLLHNSIINYPCGRHFRNHSYSDDFIIFNYGFSPMTSEIYKRKLQIQHKIPLKDKINGLGTEHTGGLDGLTEEKLMVYYEKYKLKSKNLKSQMETYINYE